MHFCQLCLLQRSEKTSYDTLKALSTIILHTAYVLTQRKWNMGLEKKSSRKPCGFKQMRLSHWTECKTPLASEDLQSNLPSVNLAYDTT